MGSTGWVRKNLWVVAKIKVSVSFRIAYVSCILCNGCGIGKANFGCAVSKWLGCRSIRFGMGWDGEFLSEVNMGQTTG